MVIERVNAKTTRERERRGLRKTHGSGRERNRKVRGAATLSFSSLHTPHSALAMRTANSHTDLMRDTGLVQKGERKREREKKARRGTAASHSHYHARLFCPERQRARARHAVISIARGKRLPRSVHTTLSPLGGGVRPVQDETPTPPGRQCRAPENQ